MTILMLPGGGLLGSTHRNDLAVRICRDLALQGFHAVRIDWHGVGDSTGFVSSFELDRPFVGDALGAVSWLEDHGLDRIAVIGTCFGARTAIAAARSIERLEGLFLVSLPFGSVSPSEWARLAERRTIRELAAGRRHRHIRSFLDRRRRRALLAFIEARMRLMAPNVPPSKPFIAARHLGDSQAVGDFLHAAVRGIPISLLYGAEDDYFADFAALREGPLAESLGDSTVDVHVVPGEVHRFQRIEAQETVIEGVRRWAKTKLPGARGRGDEP